MWYAESYVILRWQITNVVYHVWDVFENIIFHVFKNILTLKNFLQRLACMLQVIDTFSDDSNGEDFDGGSDLSGSSPNWDGSEVCQGHAEVTSARQPEFDELQQTCSDPTASGWMIHRPQCFGNGAERFSRNPSANQLTVILSAVDLPYHTSHSALRCECHTVLNVGAVHSRSGWRCREVPIF